MAKQNARPEIPDSKDKTQINAPAPYLPKTSWLRGWPGNRTRPRRSGYDPLDMDFELAHIQGVLLRKLFTLKFRTRNPIYLLGMLLCGLIFNLPLVFSISLLLKNFMASLVAFLVFSPLIALGMVLLLNLVLSIFTKYQADNDDFLII